MNALTPVLNILKICVGRSTKFNNLYYNSITHTIGERTYINRNEVLASFKNINTEPLY